LSDRLPHQPQQPRPEQLDENSLGSRVLRYAQVSGAVAGQAAKFAGARIMGRSLDRREHAGELRAALGGLKGPLMKVAQLLSTIPDALPAEYAAELAQLQSSAPPMGRPFVRRRMASELGPDWQKGFASFELDAAHAASLGRSTGRRCTTAGRWRASSSTRASPRRWTRTSRSSA
jgi:predicted unusual protein kinase regulating ubiquinone biosynthesis (AarF/ABC1/UbiB family)